MFCEFWGCATQAQFDSAGPTSELSLNRIVESNFTLCNAIGKEKYSDCDLYDVW